jgi:hypothetical protein
MGALAAGIDECAQLLHRALSVQMLNSVRLALNLALVPPLITVFEEQDYADCMLLCRAIRKAIPHMRLALSKKESSVLKKELTAALLAVESAITRAVIAEAHGEECPRVAGISVYLPRFEVHPSYRGTLWHEKHPAWGEFLTSYRHGRSSIMQAIEYAAISRAN